MRVYAYVDGFNLYHGALEGTPHRWLDPRALCEKMLSASDQVAKIKYFTARVSGNAGSPGGSQRQNAYLRALDTVEGLEVIYGKFRKWKVKRKRVDNGERVEVYNTEEKGSDVNLAVHMVTDGFRGEYDCAVVVSNDSDLREPVRIVRDELRLTVGVIVPMAVDGRYVNNDLASAASFTKQIRAGICADCQLPDPVALPNGKFLTCPERWRRTP